MFCSSSFFKFNFFTPRSDVVYVNVFSFFFSSFFLISIPLSLFLFFFYLKLLFSPFFLSIPILEKL